METDYFNESNIRPCNVWVREAAAYISEMRWKSRQTVKKQLEDLFLTQHCGLHVTFLLHVSCLMRNSINIYSMRNDVYKWIIDSKTKLDKLLSLLYPSALTVLILIESKWNVGWWPTLDLWPFIPRSTKSLLKATGFIAANQWFEKW